MEFFKTQKQPSEIDRVMANIAQAENEMNQKINQLGLLFYQNHMTDKEGLDKEYVDLMDEIKKLDENRKGFYNYKLRLEGAMLCVNCGSAISYGSVYCPICGKKATEKEAEGLDGNAEGKNTCSNCGKVNPPNSVFCAGCGKKLG